MSTILVGYTSNPNYQTVVPVALVANSGIAKDGRCFFTIELADYDFSEFDLQVKKSIEYLKQNLHLLKSLRENLSDLKWHIDFGYKPAIVEGDLAVEALLFPLKLIHLCCELRIELLVSLYDGRLFD